MGSEVAGRYLLRLLTRLSARSPTQAPHRLSASAPQAHQGIIERGQTARCRSGGVGEWRPESSLGAPVRTLSAYAPISADHQVPAARLGKRSIGVRVFTDDQAASGQPRHHRLLPHHLPGSC